MTRLVSYTSRTGEEPPRWRAGIVRGDLIVDAAQAAAPLGDGGDLSTVRGVLALGDRLGELARLAAAAPGGYARDEIALGPPVPDPDKILCVGLNYVAHAEETRLHPTAVPTIFAKFRNSLIGDGAAIVVPAAAREVDYEGELAIVIGRRARRVSAADALAHVAGVMPLNDVSARDLQMQASQWTTGKAVDTFAPCGPELVLLDEIDDIGDLRLITRVNGEVVQDASTAQMIFDVGRIVEFLSAVMTLEVGDVIATGTPEGVGFTREPPLLLRSGDEVEVEVAGVGRLRNQVKAEAG